MSVHPTTVLSKEVELADDVEIGPFCIIRGRVRIGKGTKLDSHVSIGSDYGIVEIGEHNVISAGAALGGPPQDVHYKNEPTKLVIGNHNMIREFSTVSIGTAKSGGLTSIGNNNMIMAYVHLGHDCRVGDRNVIVNSTQIAGHVHIDNNVTIGGGCGVNQFVRIGSFTFIAGFSGVNKDVIPYTICRGNYAVSSATNKIALERSGLSPELVENIHKAIRILIKGSSTISEGVDRIVRECQPCPEIDYLIKFVMESKRGVAK